MNKGAGRQRYSASGGEDLQKRTEVIRKTNFKNPTTLSVAPTR